jgi:hypothetical protein
MVRITGQRRPDRGTIGGSSADRDYRMSTYDRAAFPARRADVTAWVRETAHVEGLALSKSAESRNLSLAEALSEGCRPDRRSDDQTSLSLKPAVRRHLAVTILTSMIWRIP